MSLLLAYFTGLLTLPVLAIVGLFLSWAFSKTSGIPGPCIAHCNGIREKELGKHFNITIWLEQVKHDLFWSYRPWHRKAVREYFAKYS